MLLTCYNTFQSASAAADHVLDGTIHLGGQEHFYLEPNGCIVLPTEDDEYTLISSTQAPTKHQVKFVSVRGNPLHYGCIAVAQPEHTGY
jgi:xanthine dehydrogenase molybdopterin-binding subunit B